MKKFIVLLFVLTVLCALPGFAKATYNFETEDQDSVLVPSSDDPHFTIFSRTSDNVYEGDYAMMYVLEDTSAEGSGGTAWEVHTPDQEDPLITDLEFMTDTIFFWMYLPDVGAGVMDFIQPFTQDANWAWHGAWQEYSSATLDAWDCYPVVVDSVDWETNPRELPLVRAGVEFGSIETNPGCTVYVDLVSSESRGGGSGIELITDAGEVTLEASINIIKFSLDKPTPVLVSVYNLMGAKVAEKAPGGMSAGSHEIPVDLPAGMYIVKLVAGQVKATGKLLVF